VPSGGRGPTAEATILLVDASVTSPMGDMGGAMVIWIIGAQGRGSGSLSLSLRRRAVQRCAG